MHCSAVCTDVQCARLVRGTAAAALVLLILLWFSFVVIFPFFFFFLPWRLLGVRGAWHSPVNLRDLCEGLSDAVGLTMNFIGEKKKEIKAHFFF